MPSYSIEPYRCRNLGACEGEQYKPLCPTGRQQQLDMPAVYTVGVGIYCRPYVVAAAAGEESA